MDGDVDTGIDLDLDVDIAIEADILCYGNGVQECY